MGLLFYDADGHLDTENGYPIPDDRRFCFACGDKKPTGVWRGEIDVCVCSTCAIVILPGLITDAIVAANQGPNGHSAGAILKERLAAIICRLHQAAIVISSNSEYSRRAASSFKAKQKEATNVEG